MHQFRKLDVWQNAMTFVTDLYKVLQAFPNHEQYALSQQMRRAAVSIPSNIAEGAGRNSPKEFAHFLSIAMGSAYELDTQLEIAYNLGYLLEVQHKELSEKLRGIQGMLFRLSQRVSIN